MVSVALYDTLGLAAVRHIIQQTEMPVVVAAADKLASVLSVAPQCPALRLIVCMDPTCVWGGRHREPLPSRVLMCVLVLGCSIPPEAVETARQLKLQLVTMDGVCTLHGAANLRAHVPPRPEDICTPGTTSPTHPPTHTITATIPSSLVDWRVRHTRAVTVCYTSGTTGTPKGVLLTHGNLIANVSAVVKALPAYLVPTPVRHTHGAGPRLCRTPRSQGLPPSSSHLTLRTRTTCICRTCRWRTCWSAWW
jgi:long-chain acyl-CoA synthetase